MQHFRKIIFVIWLLFCIAGGSISFTQRIDCTAKGGQYVQGVMWYVCVKPNETK